MLNYSQLKLKIVRSHKFSIQLHKKIAKLWTSSLQPGPRGENNSLHKKIKVKGSITLKTQRFLIFHTH